MLGEDAQGPLSETRFLFRTLASYPHPRARARARTRPPWLPDLAYARCMSALALVPRLCARTRSRARSRARLRSRSRSRLVTRCSINLIIVYLAYPFAVPFLISLYTPIARVYPALIHPA